MTLSALPEALARRLPDCMIETADSAEAALALLQQGGFDLVISDLLMSGAGGRGLVKALDQLSPSVPTILITGMPETARERYPTLIVGVLHKPFQVPALVTMVRDVLQKGNRFRPIRS